MLQRKELIMEEIWKPIADHPRYEVSNFGKIRNIEKGVVYVGKPNAKGYLQVCISEDGKRKILFPHREVAKAFLPEAPGKPFVNHIDGDRGNSHIDNLEWCTPQENVWHAIHVLNHKTGGKNKKAVMCVETGEVFESCVEAAESVNGFNGQINRCCHGKRKHHHGYSWKFV